MFVLRISAVLVIACTFASSAEAQLFRWRSNVNQQQGYTSRYDAGAYQYTQVQPQANYVPSQRTPSCGCQQSALTPAASTAALNQQQLSPQRVAQADSSAQQTEVVSVLYRDPYTGRLFQQRYLVQRPVASVAEKSKDSPKQQLSQATSIGVTKPEASAGKDEIKTTSFENPVLELTDESSSVEFSVLNMDDNAKTGANSVLESSLPVLEAPSILEETPGALDKGLDLDLPPLELEDSK